MAESWDSKTKQTVQKIPLLTVSMAVAERFGTRTVLIVGAVAPRRRMLGQEMRRKNGRRGSSRKFRALLHMSR